MQHAPNIVHETLEGETIAIHLVTGNYYSLTGSGAEIWELLAFGGSTEEICAELARRHGWAADEIGGAVASFIADLKREELVQEGGGPSHGDPRSEPADAGVPWELPKLERYDDMRDFLLVDPVHDVDDAGWPAPQKPR